MIRGAVSDNVRITNAASGRSTPGNSRNVDDAAEPNTAVKSARKALGSIIGTGAWQRLRLEAHAVACCIYKLPTTGAFSICGTNIISIVSAAPQSALYGAILHVVSYVVHTHDGRAATHTGKAH